MRVGNLDAPTPVDGSARENPLSASSRHEEDRQVMLQHMEMSMDQEHDHDHYDEDHHNDHVPPPQLPPCAAVAEMLPHGHREKEEDNDDDGRELVALRSMNDGLHKEVHDHARHIKKHQGLLDISTRYINSISVFISMNR